MVELVYNRKVQLFKTLQVKDLPGHIMRMTDSNLNSEETVSLYNHFLSNIIKYREKITIATNMILLNVNDKSQTSYTCTS